MMATNRPRQGGFSLIELMVVFVIVGVMAAVAMPGLSDYMRNARLREAGNLMLGEAMYARNEAIKRNRKVRLTLSGTQATVSESATGTEIRARGLPYPVVVNGAAQTVEFDSTGRLPMGTSAAVSVIHGSDTCSSELRCPQLRVSSGGQVCIKTLNVTVTPDPCP